jgi:hypothetical protein
MNDEGEDRLTAALRALAREDAAQPSPDVEARVMSEFRALRPASRPARTARIAGFALAATLVAAVSGSLWLMRRSSGSADGAGFAARRPRIEVTTAFMPLVYSALPYTDAQIVRFEVPRNALNAFGLAPADVPADVMPAASGNTVLADVLVGEDGLARAVRFVRAERASGVAP